MNEQQLTTAVMKSIDLAAVFQDYANNEAAILALTEKYFPIAEEQFVMPLPDDLITDKYHFKASFDRIDLFQIGSAGIENNWYWEDILWKYKDNSKYSPPEIDKIIKMNHYVEKFILAHPDTQLVVKRSRRSFTLTVPTFYYMLPSNNYKQDSLKMSFPPDIKTVKMEAFHYIVSRHNCIITPEGDRLVRFFLRHFGLSNDEKN